MIDDSPMPDEIDPTAIYAHNDSDLVGPVDDWARDPDGTLKVRINDRWVFFKNLRKKDA